MKITLYSNMIFVFFFSHIVNATLAMLSVALKMKIKKNYNAPHRSFHLLFTQTTRILRRRTSDRKRRRKSTLLSNLGPSQVKPHRHRYTRKRQTTQQRSRPLHSHSIDHLRRE